MVQESITETPEQEDTSFILVELATALQALLSDEAEEQATDNGWRVLDKYVHKYGVPPSLETGFNDSDVAF